jgi:hypothetical protein
MDYNGLTRVSGSESTNNRSANKTGRNRNRYGTDNKLSVDFGNQDDFDNFIDPDIDGTQAGTKR